MNTRFVPIYKYGSLRFFTTDHMGNIGKLDRHLDHSECVCCSVADICLSSNALRCNVSLLCNVRQVFADLQCHNEPHAQDESVKNVQVA